MFVNQDTTLHILTDISRYSARVLFTIIKSCLIAKLPNAIQDGLDHKQKQTKIAFRRNRKLIKENKSAIRFKSNSQQSA